MFKYLMIFTKRYLNVTMKVDKFRRMGFAIMNKYLLNGYLTIYVNQMQWILNLRYPILNNIKNNEQASILRLSSPKQGFVRDKYYKLELGDVQTLLQERRCGSQHLLEEVRNYGDNILEEVVQAVSVRM